MISESVSDLEKSGGSAPSICIDVLEWSKFFKNDKNAGWNKSAGRQNSKN